MILAICTVSIEEFKGIERHTVYVITAFASLFAYVWMVVILLAISPNVIEVWEAVVTAAGFPLLVGIAWAVDTNK